MNMPWRNGRDGGSSGRKTPSKDGGGSGGPTSRQLQRGGEGGGGGADSGVQTIGARPEPSAPSRRGDGDAGGYASADKHRSQIQGSQQGSSLFVDDHDQVVVATLSHRLSSLLPTSTKASEGKGSGATRGGNGASSSPAAPPSLPTHPYSSIALSPDRRHAVLACKDSIRLVSIEPSGLALIKSVLMAPHLSSKASSAGAGAGAAAATTTSSALNPNNKPSRFSLLSSPNPSENETSFMDAFGLGGGGRGISGGGSGNSSGGGGAAVGGGHHHNHHSSETVTVTDVAWSREYEGSYSLIAAAGSNGTIVVWNASSLLLLLGSSGAATAANPSSHGGSSAPSSGRASGGAKGAQRGELNSPPSSHHHHQSTIVAPEAVLSQHSRAVNRLAWHPKLSLLLSASQDSAVLLWERRRQTEEQETAAVAAANAEAIQQQQAMDDAHGMNRWFGNKFLRGPSPVGPAAALPPRGYSWQLQSRFEPKSEAVRDIQWSPYYDDGANIEEGDGKLDGDWQSLTHALLRTCISYRAQSLRWLRPRGRSLRTTGTCQCEPWPSSPHIPAMPLRLTGTHKDRTWSPPGAPGTGASRFGI